MGSLIQPRDIHAPIQSPRIKYTTFPYLFLMLLLMATRGILVDEVLSQPNQFPLEEFEIILGYDSPWTDETDFIIRIVGDGRGMVVEAAETTYFYLSPDHVKSLLQTIYDQHFFELRDIFSHREYVTVNESGYVNVRHEIVLDQGLIVVTVRIADFEKIVRDEFNAPQTLREVEKVILESAGKDEYLNRD